MRSGVVVVVALLIATSAYADDQPPLETALANAATANKPLVLEFYAEWCAPCREFEAKVLPRGDVRAALRDVVFVRYDIDASPGEEIATRLGVQGVPAFVAFDADGNVVARQAGFVAPIAHHQFIELLATAMQGQQMTARLLAAIAADPNNLAARMQLAQRYRVNGRTAEAIEQLAWVADHATLDPDVAALAAAARDALQLTESRLTAVVANAEAFVSTYPHSKLASTRLVALALSKRVPRDRIKLFAMLHLDAAEPAAWPTAVRAALLVDAVELAGASVEDRVRTQPSDPVGVLVKAELLLFSGKIAEATRMIEHGCREPGHDLWCFALRQALDIRDRTLPETEQLRARATEYLGGLDQLPSHGSEHTIHALADTAPQFGDAVAHAFVDAQARCEHLAERDTVSLVHIRFATNGTPRSVRVRSSRGGELDRCVVRVLERTWFPTAPVVGELVHGAITFKAARGAERPARHARVAGVLPQLAVRRGDIETYGFRGDALVEVAGRHDRAWLVGGTAEFAGSDRGDPAYRVRALVGHGLGGLFGRHIHASVLAGAGISDLSTQSPLAFELPIELRYRIDLGRMRLHVTGELTSRLPGGMDSMFFVDTTLGAGATVAIGSRRFYLGVQHEAREGVGSNAMVTFGTAVGDAY